LIPIARHVSGTYGAGAAEITQYHSASKRIYVVNGAANAIDILDASNLKSQALTDARVAMTLNSNKFAIPSSIKTTDGNTVELGMANSIAIHGDTLAVAVENKRKSAAGVVLFYEIKSAAPLFIKALSVGALPDMLTFNADGSRVLVANEAEPETDYSADPEGSVAIISIDKGVIADQAQLVGFSDFNSKQADLAKQGVKFAGPAGTTVAQDLEPEYITLSSDGKKAYVALQENNALAVLDMASAKIDKIVALGAKDHSVHALDVSDRDGVLLQKIPGLYGLYQPDTIASYQWQGATFIVSANEGDARDWKGYSEETRVGSIKRSAALVEKQQAVYQKDGLGRLKITKAMGLNSNGEYDSLYAFGGRSFSIWDAQGRQVFDSAEQLEKISAAVHGELAFNSNHLTNAVDNRSDDKGPEPEALALGQIGGQTFAFVGTERQSGIYIFDITNPFATQFVNYSHNRDFNQTFNIDDEKVPAVLTGAYAQAGDLGPESMLFVSAAQSPIAQPLLLVANEVSGSLTVYMVQPKRAQ
jgi:DNA-binding beta-propeller fold protein YncE